MRPSLTDILALARAVEDCVRDMAAGHECLEVHGNKLMAMRSILSWYSTSEAVARAVDQLYGLERLLTPNASDTLRMAARTAMREIGKDLVHAVVAEVNEHRSASTPEARHAASPPSERTPPAWRLDGFSSPAKFMAEQLRTEMDQSAQEPAVTAEEWRTAVEVVAQGCPDDPTLA